MDFIKIEALTFDNLYKVLSSNKITERQKINFVKENQVKIAQIVDVKISSSDYKTMMGKRKLVKFRPLKNVFTKKGDKIILSKALNVPISEIPAYIKLAKEDINGLSQIDFLTPEKMELLKTYVYRHGSNDDLVVFLDYELTKSTDKLKTLYRTLQYYSGGVADYFIRPIHRMDNKTLVKVYDVITKHINQAETQGQYSDVNYKEVAIWALGRIYEIQNASKFVNAIKTYKTLK